MIADVTYRLDDGGLSVDEAELYARRVRACKALHARIDTQAVPLDEAGAVADHADPILNRDDVPAPRPRENV